MDMPDIPADAGGTVPSGGADRQPLKKEGVSALFFSYNMRGDHMKGQNCDPLALTTAINTLAVAIAGQLNDEDLEMDPVGGYARHHLRTAECVQRGESVK